MPQELHILRCDICEAFQVHIVKRNPKWQCKMCGEQQSLTQIYGKGSGKDCRLQVQQLNAKRQEAILDTSYNNEQTENAFNETLPIFKDQSQNRNDFMSPKSENASGRPLKKCRPDSFTADTKFQLTNYNYCANDNTSNEPILLPTMNIAKTCRSQIPSNNPKMSKWNDFIAVDVEEPPKNSMFSGSDHFASVVKPENFNHSVTKDNKIAVINNDLFKEEENCFDSLFDF